VRPAIKREMKRFNVDIKSMTRSGLDLLMLGRCVRFSSELQHKQQHAVGRDHGIQSCNETRGYAPAGEKVHHGQNRTQDTEF